MPYILKPVRARVERAGADTAGELNYAITRLVADYVDQHGVKYQVLNDVLGALEGAKIEFYRRVVAPYEDTKIQQNGDVYHASLLSRPDVGPSAV